VFRVEEVGHGNIITDSFMNWRIRLSLQSTALEPQQRELPGEEAMAETQEVLSGA
jgi:RAT1-interacting protein